MCKLRFSEEEEMPKILKINQIGTSLITHALCVWWGVYFFWFSENIGLVVLFYSPKKKKKLSLFFIYNFFFENQIYKWIKKFENQ